ncbi:unnamed protein product [Closterium sp. NIES-53]
MQRRQHVFVMHHGERADAADPLWARREGAERAWDPPLSEWGKYQAYEMREGVGQGMWRVQSALPGPEQCEGQVHGQGQGQERWQGQGQGQNQGSCTVAGNSGNSNSAASLAPRDWLEGMFPPGAVDRILPVVAGSAAAAADVALPGWPEDVEEAALRLLRSIDHVAEQVGRGRGQVGKRRGEGGGAKWEGNKVGQGGGR